MSDFLFDLDGRPIAFRRSWDDAFVFALDGHCVGWRPWGDCEVVATDGEPLGAIVGDRLVRRNDTNGHRCAETAAVPAGAAAHGQPGEPLPFQHRFAYHDVELGQLACRADAGPVRSVETEDMPQDQPSDVRSLVTGATGYVGGRLVPELLDAGHTVRVLVRDPAKARAHTWAEDVEIAQGDATETADVEAAMAGVDVLYYLLHSIGSSSHFDRTEHEMAERFARAAEQAGVKRIVYLSGMVPQGEELSQHLRSREQVGEVLLDSSVPTTVLQAGVVIGSGSASFEMLRYLTERLPVMVTPKWVSSRIQPIAVRDVLRYLVGSADMPASVNRRFDVGGPDVLTYLEMMQRYATVAELPRRRVLRVPLFSPGLSSHWVGLITPVPASIARPLVESLKNTVVAQEKDIAEYVPDPPEGLIGYDRAVGLALTRIKDLEVPTRWSSASYAGAPSTPLPSDPDWAGGSLYTDERTREVDASPETLWSVIEGIGGDNGWYSWNLAWWVRGLLDRVAGGPGLRRGRRDAKDLRVGDALDFWRVEETDDATFLRLRAEMRLPGLAWLEMQVGRADGGSTTFHHRALFAPRGLLGHLYWWAIYPFHGIVFGGMQRNIAHTAEKQQRAISA